MRPSRATTALLVAVMAGCGDGSGNTKATDAGAGGATASNDVGGSTTDDGGATCAFTACGGNVQGTWTMRTSCITYLENQPIPLEVCPTAIATGVRLSGSNVATFGATGSYSVNATLSTTSELSFPAGCTTGRPSCAALSTELATAFPNDFSSCTGTPATGCVCELTRGPSTTMITGSYTTAGNELVTTSTGAAAGLVYEYCVAGNTLRVRSRERGLVNVTAYDR